MLSRVIDCIRVRKAEAVAMNVLHNGGDMDAKRIIRACNVVLQSIADERADYEALFRQAFPRQHQRGN